MFSWVLVLRHACLKFSAMLNVAIEGHPLVHHEQVVRAQ